MIPDHYLPYPPIESLGATDAVAVTSAIMLERDETALAELLARRLAE